MLNKIKNWFNKGEADLEIHLPKDEKDTFILKVDNIELGVLHCENGEWVFNYTENFKQLQNEYTHIVGFPNINKVYHSETLWPFFRIRIPGLKQPSVQEIIKKENIDQHNEAALLKRFGYKTIANPYELVYAK
jgi:HipA-like protein